LANFPHACTEQLVSQAAPAVVLGNRPEFGFDKAKSQATVANLIDILRSRQNEEGGFGLWSANPKSATVPTIWALHLLTEARERGHAVPADLIKNGMRYLETLASETPDDLADSRVRAHALYVLARNGVKIGRYAAALQHWLEANAGKSWREDLASSYLGASYAIIKQSNLAEEIGAAIKLGAKHTRRLRSLLRRPWPRCPGAAAAFTAFPETRSQRRERGARRDRRGHFPRQLQHVLVGAQHPGPGSVRQHVADRAGATTRTLHQVCTATSNH
jgi:uncharacterized protein YfaS (alpha-2-macroglobulin family)